MPVALAAPAELVGRRSADVAAGEAPGSDVRGDAEVRAAVVDARLAGVAAAAAAPLTRARTGAPGVVGDCDVGMAEAAARGRRAGARQARRRSRCSSALHGERRPHGERCVWADRMWVRPVREE
jgi:hypothetical protein